MGKKGIFEEKFEQAIKDYPEKNKNQFKQGMKTIAGIVGTSISSGEFGNISAKTKKELLNALKICEDYEMDCDAVYNLNEYVFKPTNRSINTIKDCLPTKEKFRKKIPEYLKDLPNRGFIYIAWRASPLIVYYIGKTKSINAKRILNLINHGSLVTAIERGATQFTIIYPSKSNYIERAEGSFIRIMKKIMEEKGHGHEMLNERNPKFERYDDKIYDLSNFFTNMGKRVKKYNRT